MTIPQPTVMATVMAAVTPANRPAILVAVLVASTIFLGGTGDAAAPAGSRIEAVVASVFQRDDYQKTLPGLADIGADEVEIDPPTTIDEPPPGLPAAGPLLPVLARALRLVGWAVLAIAGAVVAVWVVSRMRLGLGLERPGRRRAGEASPAVRPDAARLGPSADAARGVPSADAAAALAAEGRYGDAIHALLLTALDDLGRRSGALPPSKTSREIARSVSPSAPSSAPSSAAEALDALVAAVERSRFAARAVSAADYAHCRAAYRRFAAAWPETPWPETPWPETPWPETPWRETP